MPSFVGDYHNGQPEAALGGPATSVGGISALIFDSNTCAYAMIYDL